MTLRKPKEAAVAFLNLRVSALEKQAHGRSVTPMQARAYCIASGELEIHLAQAATACTDEEMARNGWVKDITKEMEEITEHDFIQAADLVWMLVEEYKERVRQVAETRDMIVAELAGKQLTGEQEVLRQQCERLNRTAQPLNPCDAWYYLERMEKESAEAWADRET